MNSKIPFSFEKKRNKKFITQSKVKNKLFTKSKLTELNVFQTKICL